ncbi:lebocin-4-like [Ostrinia furnacalis]|uniref:lebocin-4-like n=1 Tax=Ostrinia furnacalis TaxID=93504 RepID=UPI00103BFBCA|nr:lebocin-4-like [Ostrinia furnacalis]
MRRTVLLSLAAVLAFVAESAAQHIILPTYRPPPQRFPKIYRVRRSEPLRLTDVDPEPSPEPCDYPYVPPHLCGLVDPYEYANSAHLDVEGSSQQKPKSRYARSVDSPSAKRGGGSHSTSSGSRDTGATHPGYNRRNARSLGPNVASPTVPKPLMPTWTVHEPKLARNARDIQFPQKPKHHDIVLTGWNPNARVQPWQKIRVKA